MPADWIATLSRLVERIAVQKDALQIRLRRQQVVEWLGIGTNELQTEGTEELSVPIQFRQRGNQVRVVVPAAGDERTRTPDRTGAHGTQSHGMSGEFRPTSVLVKSLIYKKKTTGGEGGIRTHDRAFDSITV